MVITFSPGRAANGPRAIDPNRDFPQLAQLLRSVFADELDSGGRQAFENAAGANKPALLWRFDPYFSRLTPGFVWEENGRIVGNVTMLPARTPGRILIANVAIDPAYRRRGIARALMDEVHKLAARNGPVEIRLQADRDNEAALALYRSLGYATIGAVTTWKLDVSRRYELAGLIPPAYGKTGIKEMPRSRWLDAYKLDSMTHDVDLYWPEPLARDEYRQKFLRRVGDLLSGRHFEVWMVSGHSNELVGIAAINGEWGRPHQLRVRVHPQRKGDLEEALVHRLLERLQVLPRRKVYMLHDADDTVMNDLLPQLRFSPGRILTQMRLCL